MACGNNLVSRGGLLSAPQELSASEVSAAPRQPQQAQMEAASNRVRSEVESVRRQINDAASATAASTAVKDAKNALDKARRLKDVPRSVRAQLLRDAEHQLKAAQSKLFELESSEHQARVGDYAVEQSGRAVRQASDRLHSMQLGVASAVSASPRKPSPPTVDPELPSPPVDASSLGTSLVDELAELRGPHPDRQQIGDFSEAVAAGFLSLVLDYELLQQHNDGDSPQGLDIQAVTSDGKVQAVEVKGTAAVKAGRPRTSKTKTGRQGGADWTVSRSASSQVSAQNAQAVGNSAGQMASRLIQVNIREGTITLWSVDQSGKVVGQPEVVAPLDDVVQAIDES